MKPTSTSTRPWFERVRRWGQTNLTEVDPRDCDIDFWRAHWRNTHTQGIIVNAGGIVAYFPSENPMQARARFLGDRDLFGEFVQAARKEGLSVLARMDVTRASEAVLCVVGLMFASCGGESDTSGEVTMT